MDQSYGISRRSVLRVSHQPGDGRSRVSLCGRGLAKAGVNEHACQRAWGYPKLLSLAGQRQVVGIVKAQGNSFRHAFTVLVRCETRQCASWPTFRYGSTLTRDSREHAALRMSGGAVRPSRSP